MSGAFWLQTLKWTRQRWIKFKIHLVCDGSGKPVYITVSSGNESDNSRFT